jgi:uncharacterized membrane protein
MKLRSRRERRIRQNLKRAGILVFLILFFISVVGVALISVAH